MTTPEPEANTQTYTSQFNPQRKVELNPFAANPLEADMAGSPAYAAAKASGVPVPKLFSNGESDVPAFTASGLDPQLLLKLPYGMRHGVAAEPDIRRVHQYFEEDASNPDAMIPHQGLFEARQRMSQWASTAGVAAENAQHDREAYIDLHANVLKGVPEHLRQAVIDRATGQ